MGLRNLLMALGGAALLANATAAAETADEKALIIQLDEVHKRGLRLTLVGDVDGLKQQIPSLEGLLQVEDVALPCREAVRAKLAAARANIVFLQGADGDGGQQFLEVQKQDRLFHDYRRQCLGGRSEP
jgi:hypothetical protein